jgi:hypothetical protein
MFKRLPPSIQRQFRAVDMRIISGELVPAKRMGWAYYVDVNDYYAAVGSYPESGVFYWVWIGCAKDRPIIL